jgi:hypothetical protein
VGIGVRDSTVAGRRRTPRQEVWVSFVLWGRVSMMGFGSARRSV